jgi:2-methylcitrate dehydratase PrpD
MTLTTELAEHFATLKPEALPDDVARHARRLLVDYFGVAIAGSHAESGRIAGDFVISMGGRPESTVIGRGDRVPDVHAAFANAVAEHSIELDDIDTEALFHYGPPIVSAALAVAEATASNGQALLAAIVAGGEMMNRLSRATNPQLRDRGFHTTPTCGAFGATVAAGHLLGLSPDQLTSALGLAGAQAAGLMEMYGTSMQKRFNPGPAARAGVTAARMAALGFTGADSILEGERGFGAAFSGHLDPAALLDDLGESIPVEIEFKPYSCARPIHNAIDCALLIRRRHGLRPADIESVDVRRHPAWASYHLIARPRTMHEAQVSLPYSVAVAFADGAALPAQYADARLASDRDVLDLAGRVTASPDPSLARGVSCRMVVMSRDGRRFEETVDHPKGSLENPMTDDELTAKLVMLTQSALPAGRGEQLAARLLRVDEETDVPGLLALTF